MGLDMYLWTVSKPIPVEIKSDINSLADFVYENKHWEVYWRKANAIHGWFVKNVQKDVDDCGYYEVTVDQLKALRELCATIAFSSDPKKESESLPITKGFFFGTYEYGDWYEEDLIHTINEINRILPFVELENHKVFYHSSW